MTSPRQHRFNSLVRLLEVALARYQATPTKNMSRHLKDADENLVEFIRDAKDHMNPDWWIPFPVGRSFFTQVDHVGA